MHAKFIPLVGLLLMLSSPTYAAHTFIPPPTPAPQQTQVEVQGPQTVASLPTAPVPEPRQLAWQRVGAPISLEG